MRYIVRVAAVALAALLAGAPASAQAPAPPPGPTPVQQGGAQVPVTVFQDSADAQSTRNRLQQILRQLPPAVGEVLRRDPSLLTRADYLEPYPALAAFLQQHPEISRYPSFYLGGFEYFERDAGARAADMFVTILAGMAGFIALAALLSVFVWLVRAIIEHRRWLRLSRVQAEVHTKVMDRLTSNEDLLAYIQTPSGRRFLDAAPLSVEGGPRRPGAPLASILWSLQGGVVLLTLGVGMWFLQGRVLEEISEGLYVIGVIAVSLGAGFVLSALMAYVISTRLGLLEPPKSEHA